MKSSARLAASPFGQHRVRVDAAEAAGEAALVAGAQAVMDVGGADEAVFVGIGADTCDWMTRPRPSAWRI